MEHEDETPYVNHYQTQGHKVLEEGKATSSIGA